MFGERTVDNCASFAIDGKETFRMIYDFLNHSKTNICITSYDIDPKLHFIRKDTQKQQQPLSANSIHFHDNAEGKGEKEKENSTQNFSDVDYGEDNKNQIYSSLEDLLITKAIEGVDIRILVWELRFFMSLSWK